MKAFPIGAKVLVDGLHEAWVRGAFPEGSTFYPHYTVDFVGGDRGVKVQWKRVGVKKKSKR